MKRKLFLLRRTWLSDSDSNRIEENVGNLVKMWIVVIQIKCITIVIKWKTMVTNYEKNKIKILQEKVIITKDTTKYNSVIKK